MPQTQAAGLFKWKIESYVGRRIGIQDQENPVVLLDLYLYQTQKYKIKTLPSAYRS